MSEEALAARMEAEHHKRKAEREPERMLEVAAGAGIVCDAVRRVTDGTLDYFELPDDEAPTVSISLYSSEMVAYQFRRGERYVRLPVNTRFDEDTPLEQIFGSAAAEVSRGLGEVRLREAGE